MTRFIASAAIAVFLVAFQAPPALSQANDDSAADTQCFPWQELRNGRCVFKPAAPQPPAPPQTSAPSPDPCTGGAVRNLSGQCKCAGATHLDAASGTCVADVVAPPAPAPLPQPRSFNIVCNGGTVEGGQCACPAGFHLMAVDDNAANGGTCVKTHADNCLGGQLTVSGTCLCIGQVVMSGETYALEFVKGKCVPKRCPEQTMQKGSKCVAISSTAAAPEPGTKPAPAADTADAEESRHHCGHGMIRTHAGCVPARRSGMPTELRRYYRSYQMPGF
jgi:hypothetical protein